VESKDRGIAVQRWIRSSRCGPKGDNCVEIGFGGAPGKIHVRDTKAARTGTILTFAPESWALFVTRMAVR
jgi:hypothetical protein